MAKWGTIDKSDRFFIRDFVHTEGKELSRSEMIKYAKSQLRNSKRQRLDTTLQAKDLDDVYNAWVYLKNIGVGEEILKGNQRPRLTGENYKELRELDSYTQLHNIGMSENLTSGDAITFATFFQKRFPEHAHDNYVETQYAREWAQRFAEGLEWSKADNESRRTLAAINPEKYRGLPMRDEPRIYTLKMPHVIGKNKRKRKAPKGGKQASWG